MSLLYADLDAPGSSAPLDLADPQQPLSVAPSIPIGDNSIYGEFGLLFAGIIQQLKTGEVFLRRREPVRTFPYKAASFALPTDYELVAYVSAPVEQREGLGLKRHYKVTISAPHLSVNVMPNDNLIIDGVEYPMTSTPKRTPKTGSMIMFWTVECGLG